MKPRYREQMVAFRAECIRSFKVNREVMRYARKHDEGDSDAFLIMALENLAIVRAIDSALSGHPVPSWRTKRLQEVRVFALETFRYSRESLRDAREYPGSPDYVKGFQRDAYEAIITVRAVDRALRLQGVEPTSIYAVSKSS